METEPVAGAAAAGDAGAAVFDPTREAFVAQSQRPAHLLPVSVAALTPFQRGLLVIDGTVTRFVEAYWLEPVSVRRLSQEELRLEAHEPWLDAAAGSAVIRRRVLLCGRRSGRFFAWADSLMAVERLGPDIRRGLEVEGGGLGRILVDTGVETRREGLWFGRERPAQVPQEVHARWPGEFLTRTYRVLAAGRPIMLITERFAL